MRQKIAVKSLLTLFGGFMLSTSWADNPKLSLGAGHACSLTPQNVVQCWGNAAYGQLGDGVIGGAREYAQTISSTSLSTMVAVGGHHSCALKSDGSVLCWGNNNAGQLGRATVSAGEASPAKVSLSVGVTITQINAGTSHTCGLRPNGQVLCWGEGSTGQLGNGQGLDKAIPVTVSAIGIDDPSKALSIAVGGNHVCARLKNNTVRCWGKNTNGELGIGTTASPQLSPQQTVAALTNKNVTALSAGYSHTCALTVTGEVWCWGNNSFGQVGIDQNNPNWSWWVTSPVKVINGGAVEIDLGSMHSCARMSNNTVQCWGKNNKGQLGNGLTTDLSVPTLITNLPSVNALAAGGTLSSGFTCASRAADNALICWGDNARWGQLGAGVISADTDPLLGVVEVTNQVPLQQWRIEQRKLSAGGQHTCATNIQNQLYCWGGNTKGQLGTAVGAGTTSSYPTPTLVQGISNVVSVEAGNDYTCAINAQNQLYCWGGNLDGQLGEPLTAGDFKPHPTPFLVQGIGQVKAIAAGYSHTCAINDQKQLYCWGNNDYGQTGDILTNSNSLTPTLVQGIDSALDLVTGGYHSCAIDAQNQVFCWGRNEAGQLGGELSSDMWFTSTPIQADAVAQQNGKGLGSIVSIAAASRHTCAINDASQLYCWGSNKGGQLGILPELGISSYDTYRPNYIPADTSTRQVAWSPVTNAIIEAGGDLEGYNSHTCAVNTHHQLTCWGDNYYGQLGPGLVQYDSTIGTAKLVNIGIVTAVTLGTAHTCARVVDTHHNVYCWGLNIRGQLGTSVNTGSYTPNPVPVQVKF